MHKDLSIDRKWIFGHPVCKQGTMHEYFSIDGESEDLSIDWASVPI